MKIDSERVPIKIPYGVAIPNYGPLATPENMIRLTRRAEALGVDSVWVADHLVAPCEVGTPYPFDRSSQPQAGKMSVIEHFYEPLTVLAWLAGATSRIRLGVSVFVLPYRNPVVTAKVVASLDALSAGRVLLGVGVGWLREEFQALGLDPSQRGTLTDEYLEICRRLWRDEVATFDGRHYHLPAVRTGPKPSQRPWPPIWIGGNSDAAFRRAARFGDGIHLIDLTPAEIDVRLPALQDALRAEGRSPASCVISLRKGILVDAGYDDSDHPLYGSPQKIRADVARYASLGVRYLVLGLRRAKSIAELEALLEEVVAAMP